MDRWCLYDCFSGSADGVSMIEHVMQKIARTTGKDVLTVQLGNMGEDDKATLVPMIEELKKTSNYENRCKEIEQYNKVSFSRFWKFNLNHMLGR